MAQIPTASTSVIQPTRRDVVRGAAALGAAIAAVSVPSFVHAAGTDALRIGLVGCGGRGTGAASNALEADPTIKLVAMGDLFPDMVELALGSLQKNAHADRIDVPKERQFVGWDAYKKVIDSVDVVLLATSPHFRPIHLAAAIEAGKHVFCEKPVATDAPGLRSVIESAKKAQEKNLTLVSGLCYRYDDAKLETMARIRDGAVGDIVAIQGNYLTTGLWTKPRKPEWSDMEWQIRNWLYFTWLSGDLITEQHIHTLDKMLWIMGNEPPAFAYASGGRACRTQPQYGNVYDHFNTVFEWKSGVRCMAAARQWDGPRVMQDVSDWIYGTKGRCNLMQHEITGENPWKRKVTPNRMYVLEHIALFNAIKTNTPINNGDYMVKATGMSLMGRMAAYTGQKITWDMLMKSEENLAPEKYEFGALAVAPIAVPGKTKYS